MKTARNIKVYGKVQNVGFRYYTRKTAEMFQISGFVMNRPDGSVYIEAEGEKEDLETFTDWCRQGPQWARVDRLDTQDIPVAGHEGFRIG
jgi:acylphosphatase